MVVPELRPWRAAGPHVVRIADAVRPRLARVAAATGPWFTRRRPPGSPQAPRIARPGTGWYTATAATAGLALAAGVATAAGPWDSTGQRTAERHRAVALDASRGTDHDGSRARAGTPPRGPQEAPPAPSVLTGLGGTATAARSAPAGKALASSSTPC